VDSAVEHVASKTSTLAESQIWDSAAAENFSVAAKPYPLCNPRAHRRQNKRIHQKDAKEAPRMLSCGTIPIRSTFVTTRSNPAL
jgi:hypothetical protein